MAKTTKERRNQQGYGVRHRVLRCGHHNSGLRSLRSLPRVLLTNPGQHWVFTFLHGLHGVLFLLPGEDMETFFQNTSKPLVVGGAALLQVEVLVGYWVMVSTIALDREFG